MVTNLSISPPIFYKKSPLIKAHLTIFGKYFEIFNLITNQ